MADQNRFRFAEWRERALAYYRYLLALSNDSFEKTVAVALAVSLVCAVMVATAAVALKPFQLANKNADVIRNLLEVVGVDPETVPDSEAFFRSRFEARVIDLDSGEPVEGIDPETFDMRKAARDPELSEPLSREEDIASIRRRPRFAKVYLYRTESGELEAIVLPVWGYGLWSTMYGFIALAPDCNTVVGINFYDHGETPGLGGEIVNPRWRALWGGKKIYDREGQVRLRLVKGGVDPNQPEAAFMVDALSGATLTSNGVTNLVHFWFGERGYRPFLEKFCKGSTEESPSRGENRSR